MIPYQQITAMLCGTAMQIAILIYSQGRRHATNTSYYVSESAPQTLIDILILSSFVLIIYGLIPWHLFRRAKTQ